MFVDTVKVFIL